jgi:hypothetical protein
MRDALNRFAAHHPEDSALDINADAAPSLALELRHILALRLARPFTHVLLPGKLECSLPSDLKKGKFSDFQLKGKYIAYTRSWGRPSRNPNAMFELPFQNHSVVVRDLISGHQAELMGEAREQIQCFSLSTDIIAFVTSSSILYVASLLDLTASPTRVKLPSACSMAVAGGGTVVCSHGPTVVIYKFTTGKSKSFSVKAATTAWQRENKRLVQRVCAMSVNEDRGTVDIIATVALHSNYSCFKNDQTDLRVVVTRFSFEGERIAQATWEKQVPGLRDETIRLSGLRPTGERGIFSSELSYQCHHPNPAMHGAQRATNIPKQPVVYMTLLYDEVKMSFTGVDLTMSPPMFCFGDYVSKPWLWKDRLYRTGNSEGDVPSFFAARRSGTSRGSSYDGPHTLKQLSERFMNPLDFYDSRFMSEVHHEDPHINSRLWPRCVEKRPTVRPGRHTLIAMNDSFAVTLYRDKFEVSCFDERVELHGAESTGIWEPVSEHSPIRVPQRAQEIDPER